MSSSLVEKSIWDHLADLKNLAIWLVLTWLFFTLASLPWSKQLVELVLQPLNGQIVHFQSPTDSVFFLIKLHSLAGLIASFPLLLVVVWRFISPALLTKEKKFTAFYLLAGTLLSFVGIVYGYFSLVPSSLKVLLEFTPDGTRLLLTANEYMNFMLSLLFVMILVFQTPVVIYGLIRSRLVEYNFFAKNRRGAYFLIIIILALLTPTPDLITLALITMPVLALFEVSLQVSRIGLPKKEEEERAEKTLETVDVLGTGENPEGL